MCSGYVKQVCYNFLILSVDFLIKLITTILKYFYRGSYIGGRTNNRRRKAPYYGGKKKSCKEKEIEENGEK